MPALRCLGLLVSAGQLILANYVYSSGPETFGLPDQPLEQEIVALARRVEALEKDLEECRASCTSREPIWITPVAPARDVDAHFSHRVGTTFRHRTVANRFERLPNQCCLMQLRTRMAKPVSFWQHARMRRPRNSRLPQRQLAFQICL